MTEDPHIKMPPVSSKKVMILDLPVYEALKEKAEKYDTMVYLKNEIKTELEKTQMAYRDHVAKLQSSLEAVKTLILEQKQRMSETRHDISVEHPTFEEWFKELCAAAGERSD